MWDRPLGNIDLTNHPASRVVHKDVSVREVDVAVAVNATLSLPRSANGLRDRRACHQPERSRAGGVSPAVVRREQFDVLVKVPAIDLELDSVVGKMHLLIEVRQIVLARPVTDLVLVATRSAVAVGATAVRLLQELLVLALQVLLEEDASRRDWSRGRSPVSG